MMNGEKTYSAIVDGRKIELPLEIDEDLRENLLLNEEEEDLQNTLDLSFMLDDTQEFEVEIDV